MGPWGILLVPLISGASAGFFAGGAARGLVPLLLVALSLFWLRTPVESWVAAVPIRARTPEEVRLVRGAVAKIRIPEDVIDYFRKTGALGGKTRAQKHTSQELSRWGKMGGRPKGSGKNQGKKGGK
jgi:hypothetical protein